MYANYEWYTERPGIAREAWICRVARVFEDVPDAVKAWAERNLDWPALYADEGGEA